MKHSQYVLYEKLYRTEQRQGAMTVAVLGRK